MNLFSFNSVFFFSPLTFTTPTPPPPPPPPPPIPTVQPAATDFLDYVFQFPSQGAFQGDPSLAPLLVPGGNPWSSGFSSGWGPIGGKVGVPLLVYNPVENLTSPALIPNVLVFPPQQAISSVALPGFWVMMTIQGYPGLVQLVNHPNLRILNDRTLMFARHPSVISTTIDVSHVNLVINIFGVYVTDGLQKIVFATTADIVLLEDGTSGLLLEDDTSNLLLEN